MLGKSLPFAYKTLPSPFDFCFRKLLQHLLLLDIQIELENRFIALIVPFADSSSHERQRFQRHLLWLVDTSCRRTAPAIVFGRRRAGALVDHTGLAMRAS